MAAAPRKARAWQASPAIAIGESRPECAEYVSVPSGKGADQMLGAAIYLAVLAFPESIEKRDRFWKALHADYLREAMSSGWAKRNNWTPPEWLKSWRPRTLYKSGPLTMATRRIERERLPAGMLANDYLVQSISKSGRLRIQPQREGINVQSLHSGFLGLARQLRRKGWRAPGADDDEQHAANFRIRAWRQSLPVLHLAIGLHAALELASKHTCPSVAALFRRPTWLPKALEVAELMRQLFAGPNTGALRIPLGKSICIAAKK